jgi:hypothetical protein
VSREKITSLLAKKDWNTRQGEPAPQQRAGHPELVIIYKFNAFEGNSRFPQQGDLRRPPAEANEQQINRGIKMWI